jgi:hypothetical protein
MLERSHKRFYLVKFLRASKKKEWILFYFSLFDRINRIFRIFFPGLPEESLEIPPVLVIKRETAPCPPGRRRYEPKAEP